MRGMHGLWRLALACAIICPATLALTIPDPDPRDAHKIHIIIRNKMQDKSNITVHCASIDDDLGLHAVEAGHYYEFSFRPNVIGLPTPTQFGCSARSRYGQADWDAYVDGDRDPKAVCLHGCDWSVTKDGVSVVDHGVPLKVRWDAPHGLWVAAARRSTSGYILAASLFILLPGFNLLC